MPSHMTRKLLPILALTVLAAAMGTAQAEGMSTPRLAGQNFEYLLGEMNRFASGERGNNADMVQIMKGVSPADREAMARYLSGL